MRGKWLLAGGVAIVAVAICGALLLRARKSQPAPAPQPAPVVAGTDVVLPGKIRARSVVEVGVPVDGTVGTLLVDAGEEVYEGQLLGRIDNSGLASEQQTASTDAVNAQEKVSQYERDLLAVRLEVSRARADAGRAQGEFEHAERNYRRQQILNKEGATPRMVYQKSLTEYEGARARREELAAVSSAADARMAAVVKSLDAARQAMNEKSAALDTAKENAASAEIRSPVSGLVVARTRSAGEEVTTAVHDLFHIATNLGMLEAVVDPEPSALAHIRQGSPALIQVAELPDPIPATVRTVENKQAIVEFTSPSPILKPGVVVHVRIKLQ